MDATIKIIKGKNLLNKEHINKAKMEKIDLVYLLII